MRVILYSRGAKIIFLYVSQQQADNLCWYLLAVYSSAVYNSKQHVTERHHVFSGTPQSETESDHIRDAIAADSKSNKCIHMAR